MDDTLDISMVTSRNSPSPPLPPCPPPLPAGGIPLQHEAPVSEEISLPPPPPPPGKFTLPPPPPPPSYGISFPTAPPPRLEPRRPKLRNFNWDALPAERVLGGRNLWTCGPQGASLQIDVVHMEELFGQREEPRKSRGTRSFKARPYQGIIEPDMKEVGGDVLVTI
ncbi:FH2 domain-containing protein 1-like [Hyla sarda]|uniref:FH2 domain-containing protein 1-like n=1 Tax=Hyla sarda TaxID=327740 RepID=UPI0024C21C99|nr:FH2 domain-containing protein 1-like [Hyla sarda]